MEEPNGSSEPDLAADAGNVGKTRTGHSRRAFLKGLGAASLAVPIAAVASGANGHRMPDVLSDLHSEELDIDARPQQAFQKRLAAAQDDHHVPAANQINNGDEALYPSGIASYTKGFAHNSFEEVDPTAYAAYLNAVRTGKRADFDSIPMGGAEQLVDPQSGLAYDLESLDTSQDTIPPFDVLTSPGLAVQMVEAYWQALSRDIPFSQWATNPMIVAAAAELSSLPAYTGPKIGGQVTPQSIFRGFTAGDIIGPYISQFFIQPFTIGVIPFNGYMTTLPGDFGIDIPSWLNIQNGAPSPLAPENPDPQLRFMHTARDLSEEVHNDVLYQEYLCAAQMLINMRAPLNSGNPYPPTLKSETGFITSHTAVLSGGMPAASVLPLRPCGRIRRGGHGAEVVLRRNVS